MYINSHALSKEYQVTRRFKGHSRSLGPQYGNCIVSPFWPGIWGCSYIFGKSVEPCR